VAATSRPPRTPRRDRMRGASAARRRAPRLAPTCSAHAFLP
jgi:hypothetical protein